MIAGIRGKIEYILPNEVYIDTNSGITYLVNISIKTFDEIKNFDEDEIIKLRTEYIVSENSARLYGFYTNEEHSLFKILTRVPRVGSTTAMSVCGNLSMKDLYEMITTKDLSKAKGIKGLGEKTILNIITYLENNKILIPIEDSEAKVYSKKNVIITCLIELGFKENQFKDILNQIDENISIEDNVTKLIKLISR